MTIAAQRTFCKIMVGNTYEYQYRFLLQTGLRTAMLFKLCEKADLPKFSMRVLRHTFATRCIEAGMKLKTLQTILGHSNIEITMNLYVHTTDDKKHKGIDQIAAALKVI